MSGIEYSKVRFRIESVLLKQKSKTKQCTRKEKKFNYPVIKIKMFSITIQNYISLSLKTLPKGESFQWLQRATKAQKKQRATETVRDLLSESSIENMGNPISKAIKEQQKKNDEEAVEAFQLMHKRMQSKIDSASAKVIYSLIL